MFKEHDQVLDLSESNLGKGIIVDIYTHYHDDPGGTTMYIVEFEGCEVFDRFSHEISKISSDTK